MGGELRLTLQWIRHVLFHRAYLDGTRYYPAPECFLYFTSRLLQRSRNRELCDLLEPLLKERLRERIGVVADALALSMRVLACVWLGIPNSVDAKTLLSLQWWMGNRYLY